MKKLLSIILCAALLGGCVLAGCGSGSSKTEDSEKSGSASTADSVEKVEDPIAGGKAVASTDKYRNVYQIFTQSFCDSDNDETGDFKGIISQLDYQCFSF